MRLLFFVLLYLGFALDARAQQDSSGVYLKSIDFKNKKLTYAINCKTQTHKIKLKSFFSRPFIVVIHNDSAYTLTKNEIYGYRDCDGVVYRFVDDKVYRILTPLDPIVIYRYFVFIPHEPTSEYFFSMGSDGVVEELTKTNLKKALPDNHRFHDLLDLNFKDEFGLATYRRKKKQYKLLMIYKQSLEKQE